MDYAKSSKQENNQIGERINTLKNEIQEKITVNEGRIALGSVLNVLNVPIGILDRNFWFGFQNI